MTSMHAGKGWRPGIGGAGGLPLLGPSPGAIHAAEHLGCGGPDGGFTPWGLLSGPGRAIASSRCFL